MTDTLLRVLGVLVLLAPGLLYGYANYGITGLRAFFSWLVGVTIGLAVLASWVSIVVYCLSGGQTWLISW